MTDPAKIIISLGCFGTIAYIVRLIALQIADVKKSFAPRPYVEPQDDRLARLEHAVESIAIEVERISEGQRFTTKLLSERVAADQARASLPPVPKY
jgi:hypothetical protein